MNNVNTRDLKNNAVKKIMGILHDSKLLMFSLYVIAVTISGFTTIRWLDSTARDKFGHGVSIGMSIVFVLSNIGFYAQSLNPKRSEKIRKVTKIYWSIALLISIMGTTLYIMNDANEIANETRKDKFQYEEAKTEKNRLNKAIEKADQDIEAINQQITDLNAGEESKNKVYAEYDAKIKSAKKEYDTKIASENNSLNSIISPKKSAFNSAKENADWCKTIKATKDQANYEATMNKLQNEISTATEKANVKITELTTNKEKDVQKLENEKNNYFVNKEQTILNKNNEIAKIRDQKEKDNEAVGKIDLTKYDGQVKATKGSNAFIDLIVEISNGKILYSVANGLLSLFLAIVLELFACQWYFLSRDFSYVKQENKPENTPPTPPSPSPKKYRARKRDLKSIVPEFAFTMPDVSPANNKIITSQEILDLKATKKAGLSHSDSIDKNKIDLAGVKEYLDYIYDNLNTNGTVPGYQSVAKIFKTPPTKIGNIVSQLKGFKILHTVKKQTFTLVSKQEAYAILKIQ